MAIGTTIPRTLVGRNAAVFYGVALVINSDGSLSSNGDYQDFHSAGTFDTFEFSADFGLEDVTATDAYLRNYAPTTGDFDLTFGEIQSASGYSKMAQIGFSQSNYIGLEAVTQDPVTGQQMVFAAYGVFGGIKFGLVRGKNVIMATIKPCGIYPYYQPAQGTAGGVGANGGGAVSTGLTSGNIRTGKVITGLHP